MTIFRPSADGIVLTLLACTTSLAEDPAASRGVK